MDKSSKDLKAGDWTLIKKQIKGLLSAKAIWRARALTVLVTLVGPLFYKRKEKGKKIEDCGESLDVVETNEQGRGRGSYCCEMSILPSWT